MNKMIKKIELDLGGKKVSLTPEQAKNLKAALDELFGKQVVREVHEHHHHDYTYPITYPRPYCWEWQPYRITCTDYDTAGNYSIAGTSFDSTNAVLCLSA
jgi:hypothetical protein